jgi:hypothetical protein
MRPVNGDYAGGSSKATLLASKRVEQKNDDTSSFDQTNRSLRNFIAPKFNIIGIKNEKSESK